MLIGKSSKASGGDPASQAPLAALAVFLAVLLAATAVALLGQPVPSSESSAVSPESLARVLEAQRTEATRLQQLLVFLAGVGVVYALVQGLFAFLTVEAFSKRARELHGDYEKDLEASRRRLEEHAAQLERLEERVQARYPLFANMDSGLRHRFAELQRMCERLGLGRNRYSELSESDHETIAYLERALPLLEAIEPPGSGNTVRVLTRLSVYYLARAENDQARQEEWKQRSRFLLRRAAEHDPLDHRLLNEKAHRIMFRHDPEYQDKGEKERYDRAAELFTESLRRYQKQSCALYNLAWIDDERGDLTQARQRLEDALKYPHWETEGDMLQAKTSSVSYNLACCLARLAERDGRTDLLEEALKHLEDCVNAYPRERENFQRDLTEGELRPLLRHPQLRTRVEVLLKRVYG